MTDIEALIARGVMTGPWRHNQVFRNGELIRDEILSDAGVIADDIRDPDDAAAIALLPELITHIRALSGAVEAEQWQPIETAPKDGEDVLLYVPGDCDSPYHILTGYWETNQWSDNTRGSYWGFEPTHWKPLTLPPSDAKDRP